MKLTWSPEAHVDLREMVLYLADKNPYAARALYERIEIVAAKLVDTPIHRSTRLSTRHS